MLSGDARKWFYFRVDDNQSFGPVEEAVTLATNHMARSKGPLFIFRLECHNAVGVDSDLFCFDGTPAIRALVQQWNVDYQDTTPIQRVHQTKTAHSSRFGFFDQGFLADDDDDTGISDVEAALVGFEVIADLGALGKADVAVDDGAADARVAADVHVVVNDGI